MSWSTDRFCVCQDAVYTEINTLIYRSSCLKGPLQARDLDLLFGHPDKGVSRLIADPRAVGYLVIQV
jgi:hypothetical protein